MATGNTKILSDLCSTLIEASPAALFVYDPRSLRILAANDKAQARYGYSGQEFHSMTVRNLRPANGPALSSALYLDHDAPSRSLWTHVTKQGEPFPVELSVLPFCRGRRRLALLSVVDATNWSQSRLNLIRSEQIHRSLVDRCPVGIYRFDLVTQRFEQANPALLELLGYGFEELRGMEHPAIFAGLSERDPYLAGLRDSVSIGEVQTGLRCRDGRFLCVTISSVLGRDPETGHACVQAYVRDRFVRDTHGAGDGDGDRMEAIGRFAGGVAHDFNNITQSIGLSCELALRSALPLPVRSKLFGIMQQANRAADITQRLLAFSRRQILQPRAIDLNDCIEAALPALSRSLGLNISLDLRLDEDLAPVFVDPEQLTLVLTHLADNARVAMPDGGVLRISTAWAVHDSGNPPVGAILNDAALNATRNKAANDTGRPPAVPDPNLLLTVSDTGVGMDEATRQRIFEPFFSTKKTAETAGLGLATVHGIIHQSRGRIECESAPGHGSTFRIFLPCAASAPAEHQAAEPSDATATDQPFRILLVDEEPVANSPLTEMLQAADFAVDVVSDGQEALASFVRRPYDLVVSGIATPALGGVELTRRLRQLAPAIPVVLISGRRNQGSVLEELPHSHIAYLQKPFSGSLLVAIVRNLLPAPKSADPDHPQLLG